MSESAETPSAPSPSGGRAVRVHEFGPVSGLRIDALTEDETRAPGEGEVVIGVAAAGLNFPDLLVAGGTYQSLPRMPFTLGMEAAGTVVAVGDGVEGFAEGDRVVALVPHGAFADRLVVSADRVYAIPDIMPFDEAAGFGLAFATAHFALVRRGGLRGGDTVLITGVSGGIGAAAAIIASSRGARVIGATRDAERARAVVGGAVDAFVSSDPARLRDETMAATEGRGADAVIDVVGGDVLAQALRCTAWEGTVVVVGFAGGGQSAIKPGHLLVKNIGVCGLQITDYIARTPELVRDAMREMGEDYAAGRLRIPVTARFALEEVAASLEALRRGEICGKAVVMMDRGEGLP